MDIELGITELEKLEDIAYFLKKAATCDHRALVQCKIYVDKCIVHIKKKEASISETPIVVSLDSVGGYIGEA